MNRYPSTSDPQRDGSSLREIQRHPLLFSQLRSWAILGLFLILLGRSPASAEAVLHRYFDPGAAPGGDGTTASTAVRFRESEFVRWIQGLPDLGTVDVVLHFLPGVHEGVVLQVGGTVSRPHRNGVPSTAWKIGDWSIHIVGHGSHPSETVLRYPGDRYSGASPNGYSEAGMVVIADTTPAAGGYAGFNDVAGGRRTQAAKVVVENLTFDCNWRGQRALGDPASPLAYRLFAVHVVSAQGRFRNLVVRDHGARGLVCRSRFDNPAGVENFPLMIQAVDDGQEPTLDYDQVSGDALRQGRPWLVEGCEIHGFNNSRAGYNTAIMVSVVNRDRSRPTESAYVHHHPPNGFLGDVGRRFALVRNNQIRGGGIAFGQAGPGQCTGSTFSGNATVGSEGGYNADTHAVVAADLTNNVFLDTLKGVRLATHGFTSPVSINHHRIAGNLFRLDLSQGLRVHDDYRTVMKVPDSAAYGTRISDPSMVLGGRYFNRTTCWFMDGSTLGGAFEDNCITTRSRIDGGSDWIDPALRGRFRPVWIPSSQEVLSPFESGTFVRPPSRSIALAGNRVSGFADVFRESRSLGGDGVYDYLQHDTPSASGLLAAREALPKSGSPGSVGDIGFLQLGKAERLHLFTISGPQTFEWKRISERSPSGLETTRTTLQGQSRLVSVGELQFLDLRIDPASGAETAGRLRGRVRLVRHHLPGNSDEVAEGSGPGRLTRSLAHREIKRIRFAFSGCLSSVLTRSSSVDGLCDFELPIPPGTPPGIIRLTAYWNEMDPSLGDAALWGDRISPGGTVSAGDPERYQYRCAISSASVVHGQAVEISATPNVANDRNPSMVPQRPIVTVSRVGDAGLGNPLPVELAIPSLLRWRFRFVPETGAVHFEQKSVHARYGNGKDQDFRLLLKGNPVSTSQVGDEVRVSLTIPANQKSVDLTWLPVYDDLTEEEASLIRVVPGTDYGAGEASEVVVHVYDGPEFVLRELTDSRGVNGSSIGRGINSDPSPIIAGNVFNYGPRGGVWVHPLLSSGFQEVQSADPSGFTHEALAVTDTVAGRYLLAGSRWTGSRKTPWAGVPGAPVVLPTLTGGLGGQAVSVTLGADSTAVAVGWSERRIGSANVPRPVAWRRGASGGWAVEDLGSLQPEDPMAEGQATAVDGVRSIGGWSRGGVESVISTNSLGFHITGGRSRIDREKDIRLPVGIRNLRELPGLANSAVYGIGRSTTAAGVSFGTYRDLTNASIWRAGAVTAEKLFTPSGVSGAKVSSDALLLVPPEFPLPNWKDRPLGRIWTNSIATAVAVVWPIDSQAPVALDDPHLTAGAQGWRLTRPHGASASGSIVGEGTVNGISRGFVLVSRK